MSDMWQELAVALIVAVAALYAVWRLMPLSWRQALATRLGRRSDGAGCGGCQVCASPAAQPQTQPVTVYRARRSPTAPGASRKL